MRQPAAVLHLPPSPATGRQIAIEVLGSLPHLSLPKVARLGRTHFQHLKKHFQTIRFVPSLFGSYLQVRAPSFKTANV
jgi:hypothetical protein